MAETPVDLLIIGGGITGAGIARDAALRGFRTALIDKSDFGAGTSSHSSRLIHGGIRYLEQYAFHLVFEASRERRVLLRIAPHLVRPLAFLFPVYRGARVPGGSSGRHQLALRPARRIPQRALAPEPRPKNVRRSSWGCARSGLVALRCTTTPPT
jgi:glycerol-3-phosphate dehydrogenase